MGKVLIFFALGFVACGSNPARIVGQDEAESVVWCQTYHAHRFHVPPITWVRNLPCAQGHGFYTTVTPGGASTGSCVGGYYWDVYDFAFVALPPGETFSETAYAHELLHAYERYTTGNLDPNHTGPDWQPGGLLERANEALAAVGL